MPAGDDALRTTAIESSITFCTSGGVTGGVLANKLDRHAAVPHGAMHRAVDRLILRREQRFDLIVGRVDRAGPPRFVGALAAQHQRVSAKEVPPVGDVDDEVVSAILANPSLAV